MKKNSGKTFPKIAIYSFLLAYLLLLWLQNHDVAIDKFYAKMQAALFTGFLTLGGFLLSLKTFTVIQLKKELFESAEYKQHFAEVQKIQQTASLYQPLKNLGEYLLYSVLFALLTSACQLTVGLIDHYTASIFCLSMAITTLCVVFRAWLAIRKTLMNWFQQLP